MSRTKFTKQERAFRLLLAWGCANFLPKGTRIIVPRNGEEREFTLTYIYTAFRIGSNPFGYAQKQLHRSNVSDIHTLVGSIQDILEQADADMVRNNNVSAKIKLLEDELAELKKQKATQTKTTLF